MKNPLAENFEQIAGAMEAACLAKAKKSGPRLVKKLQQLSGLLFAANKNDAGGQVDEMQERLANLLKTL